MGAAVEWWRGQDSHLQIDYVRVNQWRRFVAEQGMPLDALSYLSYPSEMVRKTGFDPVTPCSPSTCSAWLSYFLIKNGRSGGIRYPQITGFK